MLYEVPRQSRSIEKLGFHTDSLGRLMPPSADVLQDHLAAWSLILSASLDHTSYELK